MARQERFKTKYPGVYYIEGKTAGGIKSEKIYYIFYRLNGKQIEEKAGRQYADDMTPAKAAGIRADRMQRKELSNSEKREQKIIKAASQLDSVFTLYCAAKIHKKSLSDEQSYYKNWIAPAIGSKRLDEITLSNLNKIRTEMTAAGKALRSIQYIKSIVRQVYNFAIEEKLYNGTIPTKNFLKGQKFRLNNKRQQYLSPEEASSLLAAIRPRSEQTYNICLLSLNTGMRFGEIASLQWQHVNLTARSITIIDPKAGENRTAFMSDAVVSMFQGITAGKPNELVFPSRTGGKMQSVSKVFFRAVDALGLNEGVTDRRMKIVFHSLRHSCASWLVNAGVELPTIAKILGHKNLVMTSRYSHVNDTSVRNAMRTLDQAQKEQAGNVVEINNK